MNHLLQGIPVVLASGSPRRKELLRLICPEFSVRPTDTDETITEELLESGLENIPTVLAARKALAAQVSPEEFVIACDTAVIVDGEVLGKPADEADAVRMLQLLSGNIHDVVSGVCLRYQGRSMSFSESTSVLFYQLTDKEIADYVQTGEPFDKAGAYGIQEKGALLVRMITGDFYNVVGLPVARLNREIDTFLQLIHSK